jgi:hypothetical protein
MPEAINQVLNGPAPGPPPALPIHPGIFPQQVTDYPKSMARFRAGVGPQPMLPDELTKALAGASRGLNPYEQQVMQQYFGKSLSPDEIRLLEAAHPGAARKGDVADVYRDLPSMIFYQSNFPLNKSYPSSYTGLNIPTLPHELFHVWQNLTGTMGKFPSGAPATHEQAENMADFFAAGDPVLKQWVSRIPVYNQQRAGEMAFLDSVRDYLQRGGK